MIRITEVQTQEKTTKGQEKKNLKFDLISSPNWNVPELGNGGLSNHQFLPTKQKRLITGQLNSLEGT